MRIAVLALQGAFAEHEQMLAGLGTEYFEIRKKTDAEKEFDALILPGGESTVMGKLLREMGILPILKEKIKKGLPVLGTCAGLILLAERLAGSEENHLGTFPITVERNAYGRQLGSFTVREEFKGIGEIPMVFIRAPYISEVGKDVEILAEVDGRIAAVRYGKQIGIAFHPELTGCEGIYKMLLEQAADR